MELRQPHQTTSDSGEGSGPQKKKFDKQQSVVVDVVDDDHSNYYKGLVKQQQDYSSSDRLVDLGVADSASSNTLSGSGAGSEPGVVRRVLGFRTQKFDFGNMVDPESGRCRRTDGKRWRCGRKAIPVEKYCEQHVHRGRNRSSKHVESLETKPPPVELPSATSDSRPSIKSTPSKPRGIPTVNSPVAKFDYSLSVVANTFPSCSDKNDNSCGATTVPISASCPTVVTSPASTASEDVTKTETDNVVSVSSNKADDKKHDKEDNYAKDGMDYHSMIRCSEDKKHAYTSTRVSNGIDISAKSVLPVSASKDKDNIASVEIEMSRCRRTDGKKWRCKRDVLPQQKYCARHMHRGAKRRQAIPQLVKAAVRSAIATPSDRLLFRSAAPVFTKAQVSSPSTKLSMSIPGRPQLIHKDDEKSFCSSDTDTTISDSFSDYTIVAA